MTNPSRTRPVLDGWRRSILFAVAVFGVTRLAFLLIGAYSFRLAGEPARWVDMWVQWDAGYYLEIAGLGYRPPVAVTGAETGQSDINFFPMLPIVIAAVHLAVPSLRLAGVVAANVCLLAATILLHRLAAARFDRSTADWSVLSLMLLPGSFALSGPLSEAPFLVFSVLAAYLVHARNSLFALSSGLLTITRWTGIIQGMGFVVDWLVERVRGGDADYRRLLAICLIPAPLLLFLTYMFHLTGDALAPLHSNFLFWHQHFGIPFQSLLLFARTSYPQIEMQSGVTLLLVLLTLCQARQFTPGEMLFVVASVVSFTSSDAATPSMIRYTIGLYPVHLAVGRLCGRHDLMRLLLLCLALVGAAVAMLWFHGSTVYV